MKCPLCKTTDPSKFGSDPRCRDCNVKRARLRYKNNPEIARKTALKSYWKHRDRRMAHHKLYEQRVKDEVFNHYGGYKCACCGETEKLFLTLDHIHGGGNKHRKELKGGGKFHYRWARKNNYPDGYRVLCFNCNSGRALNNGICPHEKR